MTNKRWALFGALTLIAVLALAACGQGATVTEDTGGEDTGGEATEAAPAERTTEDTIIVCMAQEPDTLYMMVASMAVASQVAHGFGGRGYYADRAFFYETQLLANDEFPTLENGGAVIDDADQLVVTFTFKPGITWSDGEPFTVDDLIFTREATIAPDSGAASLGTLPDEVWTQVDDLTLTVTYPPGVRPATYYLPSLAGLGDVAANIMPRHTLGDMAPADIVDSDYARMPDPVLGPYHVTEWVAGDHLTTQAVENWWGGEVATPTIIYRFISDTNQLLAAILSGDCDYGTSDGLQLTQLPIIQEAASQGWIQYEAIAGTTWEHIDFNTWPDQPNTESGGLPFFVDVRVRQAVAYGTNRLQMTEQILYGEVEPLGSYLPSDHWAWNPETDGLYPYDPDQARALLAEAGWADGDGDGVLEAASDLALDYSCNRGSATIPAGTRFEVSYHTTTGNAMRNALMAIFQSNMADIGITVNLEPIPASVWFADDGPLTQRTFQVGGFAFLASPDPSGYIGNYLGENVYSTPDGDFLVGLNALEAYPGLLDGTGIDEFTFVQGRPADDDLPEGWSLLYNEQVPSEADNWEGGNYTAHCNPVADQALYDATFTLSTEERLPFYATHQAEFAADVPTLPLFQRLNVEAWVLGLCGPDLGPATYSSWNIETWVLYTDGGACE